MINLIVAKTLNGGIGKDNRLLWNKLSNDMQHFRNMTYGNTVVMGRKTFESLGNKPLPFRDNVIMTQKDIDNNIQMVLEYPIRLYYCNSVEYMVNRSKEKPYKEFFIIGGGEIYKQFLPYADRIYLTIVDAILDANTFFPEFDLSEWMVTESSSYEKDEKNEYSHDIFILDKRKIK